MKNNIKIWKKMQELNDCVLDAKQMIINVQFEIKELIEELEKEE